MSYRIRNMIATAIFTFASLTAFGEEIDIKEIAEYTGISSDGVMYVLDLDEFQETFSPGHEGSGVSEQIDRLQGSDEEYMRLIALPPISPGNFEPEVIIGTDDRKKVANTASFPYSAQVLVELPSGKCSGAMISKDTVITAGHCVHSGGSGGTWYRWARVYPGKNGSSSPFGSCMARKLYSVVGWTRDRNPNYDFGAIKLNCDIGTRTGWMGFWWQSATLVGTGATISSYPFDKALEQWGHADQVRANSSLRTYYQTDTVGGNSGSGVFTSRANCGQCIHTVHAYGSSANNSGTRITQPLFNNLMRWRSEN